LIEKVLGRLNHCSGEGVRSLCRVFVGWFNRFKKARGRKGKERGRRGQQEF